MIAYSVPQSRESQVFVYRVDDGTVVNLSGLPGSNDQPVWARESEHPCLLFRHDETGTDSSVYLGCLTPEPRTQLAIPVGQHPLWFEPSVVGWTQ